MRRGGNSLLRTVRQAMLFAPWHGWDRKRLMRTWKQLVRNSPAKNSMSLLRARHDAGLDRRAGKRNGGKWLTYRFSHSPWMTSGTP